MRFVQLNGALLKNSLRTSSVSQRVNELRDKLVKILIWICRRFIFPLFYNRASDYNACIVDELIFSVNIIKAQIAEKIYSQIIFNYI